jgi:hypothetical protein
MKTRASATWAAIAALWWQLLLVFDQLLNVLVCGVVAIVVAACSGAHQAVAYADETMSAHAWRAYDRGRLWGRFWLPVIDFLFIWQAQDEEVNKVAGRAISGHCERAFWKERLMRSLPPEYRQPNPSTTEGETQ